MAGTKETLYESTHRSHSFTLNDGGILQFSPGAEEDANGKAKFGEVNIASMEVLRKSNAFQLACKAEGLNEEAIAKLSPEKRTEMSVAFLRKTIEDHDDFTTNKKLVGVRGIWPKGIRASAQQRADSVRNLTDTFQRLDDGALEAVIKSKGGKSPKNADHNALVAEAVKLHEVETGE